MKEKELDQFFTTKETAKEFIDLIEKLGILERRQFIEPSAGDGVFIDELTGRGYDGFSFDIDPKREETIKTNFLGVDWSYSERYVTIGNPPYGKKGKLAVEFINKAFTLSDYVCFIVPKTLSTSWTAQKHVNQEARLIYDKELSDSSFRFMGSLQKVPSHFQIWTTKEGDLNLRLKKTPNGTRRLRNQDI